MRVKGPAVMGKGSKKSVMSMYSQPEETKERGPSVLEGYLKLLKQTGMKSSWQKKYFVLTNTTLAYYSSSNVRIYKCSLNTEIDFSFLENH